MGAATWCFGIMQRGYIEKHIKRSIAPRLIAGGRINCAHFDGICREATGSLYCRRVDRLSVRFSLMALRCRLTRSCAIAAPECGDFEGNLSLSGSAEDEASPPHPTGPKEVHAFMACAPLPLT